MTQSLAERIHDAVPATGANGFERLVAALLESLTGIRYSLAASGNQAGRDLTSDEHAPVVVHVECKRHADKAPSLDQLLGRMQRATLDDPLLDVWVLAATCEISTQIRNDLERAARAAGIDCHVIAQDIKSPSTIDVLLAESSDILMSFLPSRRYTKALSREIERVRAAPGYQAARDQLADKFSEASVGWQQWRARQNDWLCQQLRSDESCRSAFGQPLAVASETSHLIGREQVAQRLSQWWATWKDHSTAAVLLGEEGDGKTWAAASWAHAGIQCDPRFPATVLVNARKASSQDPHQLVADSIRSSLGTRGADAWDRRLRRWLAARARHPTLLLILDGLNERMSHVWWRELIDGLRAEPWASHCALLLTCRSAYWRRYFQPLALGIQEVTVPPFDDSELSAAFAARRLSLGAFSDGLDRLIRKPRYLDLVVRHSKRLVAAEDFTEARLIYEDWKDRYCRTHISLDDEGFRNVLAELTNAARTSAHGARDSDVMALLPGDAHREDTLRELWTGGVLEESEGRFKVESRRLTLGLGLLLAREVRSAAQAADGDLEQAIAEWLEPQPGIDLKANILECACIDALSRDFPRAGRTALLAYFTDLQNVRVGALPTLSAYLPLCPQAYVDLAESIWRRPDVHTAQHRWLMAACLQHRENPSVATAFVRAFERWAGFVHPHGSHAFYSLSPEMLAEIERSFAERVGTSAHSGTLCIAGMALSFVDEPNLLRLARFALGVISWLPRAPFLGFFVRHAMTQSAMGDTDDRLAPWVLRSARDDIEAAMIASATKLVGLGEPIAIGAARRLLYGLGSRTARELLGTLPPTCSQIEWRSAREQYRCAPGFKWERNDCEECLSRADVDTARAAERIAAFCVDPTFSIPEVFRDRLAVLAQRLPGPQVAAGGASATVDDHELECCEAAFCAFAPEAFADVMRRVALLLADASDIDRIRSVFWTLRGHELVLGQDEHEPIARAHARVVALVEPGCSSTLKYVEAALLSLLLPRLLPDEQLQLLCSMPGEAFEDAALAQVRHFLVNPDSRVRAGAMDVLLARDDEGAGTQVYDSGWRAQADACSLEGVRGADLLVKGASGASLREFLNRIPRDYVGLALKQRGWRADDIETWADDIQSWLGNVPGAPPVRTREAPIQSLTNRGLVWGDVGPGDPALWRQAFDEWVGRAEPTEVRARVMRLAESLEGDDPWHAQHCDHAALEFVTLRYPSLAESWVRRVDCDNDEARGRLHAHADFYERLTGALLRTHPEYGARLYRRMNLEDAARTVLKPVRDRLVDAALWSAPASDPVSELRTERVQEAKSDGELAQLAFSAEWGGSADWLFDTIKRLSHSPRPLDRARSFAIAGFMNDGRARDLLTTRGGESARDWVEDVAAAAVEVCRRNDHAKHWYQRFLTADTDIRAWAAFRLLRRRIDARWLLWKWREFRDLVEAARPPLRVFLAFHRSDLEKLIEERTQELKGTFLGHKVLDRQTWPWMSRL